MKILSKKDWQNIISGAEILSTGGGGTINSANKLLSKATKRIELTKINELKEEDILCTVFGVGVTENCDPVEACKRAILLFQKVNNKTVSAIIPVEVGSESIAISIFISSMLNIPLLDSDIVGMRSSPEVFLETISVVDLKRTPCVICDDKGNELIIEKEKNPEEIERLFRNFAVSVGGDAFVAGYPLEMKTIQNVVPDGSITYSKKIGVELLKFKNKKINLLNFCKNIDWKLIDIGVIEKVKKDYTKGFVEGEYVINSKKNIWKIIFKNENIVLIKNNKVKVTSPDSISLLDLNLYKGVNNFKNNKGKKVAILAKKAIPIWRTIRGKKLFSPKNIGLDYEQKLL